MLSVEPELLKVLAHVLLECFLKNKDTRFWKVFSTREVLNHVWNSQFVYFTNFIFHLETYWICIEEAMGFRRKEISVPCSLWLRLTLLSLCPGMRRRVWEMWCYFCYNLGAIWYSYDMVILLQLQCLLKNENVRFWKMFIETYLCISQICIFNFFFLQPMGA